MANQLIGAVTRIIKEIRNYAGSLSFFLGSIARKFSISNRPSGSVSSSGLITRLWNFRRTYAGSLLSSSAISVIANRFVSYGGDLSFSGIVSGLLGALSYLAEGAMSLSGTIGRWLESARVYAGSLLLSGTLSREGILFRIYAGSISFIGSIYRNLELKRVYEGLISFSGSVSGAIIRQYNVTVQGFLDATIRPLIEHSISFVGVVRPSALLNRLYLFGQATWRRAKILASVLSPYGLVSRILTSWRSLSGSISFSGIITGIKGGIEGWAGYPVGAISFIGSIIQIDFFRTLIKTSSSALYFTGIVSNLLRYRVRNYSGVLNFTGLISSVLESGFIQKHFYRTYAGLISFLGIATGILIRFRIVSGGLSFVGSAIRSGTIFLRNISGSISFYSDLTWRKTGAALDLAYSNAGQISFSATVSRILNRLSYAVNGALAFAGSALATLAGPINLSSSLAMAGNCSAEKVIEVLYLGIRNE